MGHGNWVGVGAWHRHWHVLGAVETMWVFLESTCEQAFGAIMAVELLTPDALQVTVCSLKAANLVALFSYV